MSDEESLYLFIRNHIDDLIEEHKDKSGVQPKTLFLPETEEEQSLYMWECHIRNMNWQLHIGEDFYCE